MVSDSLKYYKPSGKAWVAVSVIALAVVAIVYAVFASDWSVKLNSVLQLEIKNGDGATDINIYQIQPQTRGFGA
jgi:hypothetical protein